MMKAVFLLLVLLPLIDAHGRLSYPPPRGNLGDWNSVNMPMKSFNLCRGARGAGPVTNVARGGSINLQFSGAGHIGPCEVTLLNQNLGGEQSIARTNNCFTQAGHPTLRTSWSIRLPAGVTGRRVLRWKWTAIHLGANNPEYYENCADININ